MSLTKKNQELLKEIESMKERKDKDAALTRRLLDQVKESNEKRVTQENLVDSLNCELNDSKNAVDGLKNEIEMLKEELEK